MVLGFLRNIKGDKSPGSDGIYPIILREAREEIAGALTELFVSSLATGEEKEDWRIADACLGRIASIIQGSTGQ